MQGSLLAVAVDMQIVKKSRELLTSMDLPRLQRRWAAGVRREHYHVQVGIIRASRANQQASLPFSV